jgi:hypothetical protein
LEGRALSDHEVVIQAVQAGWRVKALVRSSEDRASQLRQIGARPVFGDAYQPRTWIAEAARSIAWIDLTQPKFPKRLTRSAIRFISTARQAMTQAELAALGKLRPEERPIFFSVSG